MYAVLNFDKLPNDLEVTDLIFKMHIAFHNALLSHLQKDNCSFTYTQI